MAGIGNVQLGVTLTGSDAHNLRLTRTATGMASTSGGFIWNPTSRAILKKEETDKQSDDNLIFLFEYRTLLNSRVQTLIAQLSNALASDLDIAMNASNPAWGNTKPAMNGNSTNAIQDAGAGRTAYNFMRGWFQNVTGGGVALTGNPVGPAAPFAATFNGDGIALDVAGTGTIVTGKSGLADLLYVNGLATGSPSFNYNNQSSSTVVNDENNLDNSFNNPMGQAAIQADAKNLFQKVLFDAVSSVEYRSVLSSSLFKNVVVAASSSLPTGSQIQASFNLSYTGTQEGGYIEIKMDKMTAFYHS